MLCQALTFVGDGRRRALQKARYRQPVVKAKKAQTGVFYFQLYFFVHGTNQRGFLFVGCIQCPALVTELLTRFYRLQQIEIGRASCRERVLIAVGAISIAEEGRDAGDNRYMSS